MTPEQYRILFDEPHSNAEEGALVEQELQDSQDEMTQRWANTVLAPKVPIPPPEGLSVSESAPITQFRITPAEPEPEPAWLWKPEPPSFWKRLRSR